MENELLPQSIEAVTGSHFQQKKQKHLPLSISF